MIGPVEEFLEALQYHNRNAVIEVGAAAGGDVVDARAVELELGAAGVDADGQRPRGRHHLQRVCAVGADADVQRPRGRHHLQRVHQRLR